MKWDFSSFSNTVHDLFLIYLSGQLKEISLEFFSLHSIWKTSNSFRDLNARLQWKHFIWGASQILQGEQHQQHVFKIHACVILLKWLDLFLLTSHFQLQRISWLCLCRFYYLAAIINVMHYNHFFHRTFFGFQIVIFTSNTHWKVFRVFHEILILLVYASG